MKKIIIIIFAIALSLTGFSQGVRHSQLAPIQPTLADSLLMYIYSPDGNWSIGKRAVSDLSIDTTQIDGLQEFVEYHAPSISESDPIYSAWDKDYNDLTNKPNILDSIALYQTDNQQLSIDSIGRKFTLFLEDGGSISFIDTNTEYDLSPYATISQLGDSITLLRSEIPTLLTQLDSVGFTITESQISDLQDYLTNSDLSGLRDSTLANTGKDTTGIYHANRALLDAITENDTTRWGEQPEFLTDLDSTNFDIDTTQVRNLKTFVENNSGEASISGTAGYIPKFGVSGLTESVVYEDGSGNIGIGTNNPSEKITVFGKISSEASSGGKIVVDGTVLSGVSNINYTPPTGVTTSQLWLNPITPIGTETALVRAFRNTNTTALAMFQILKADGTSSVQTQLAANSNSFLNAITGNVGIGTTSPTEKLEVNGNIKADEATEVYHVPTYGQAKIDSFWVDGKITYYRQGGELDSIRGDTDELEIGDFYQGGYIFYLSEDKETGMVCSPYLGTAQWSPTTDLVGGTLSTFGSGGLNTTKIIDEFGVGNYAAYLCSQYSVFGYDDWFLPSTGEVSLIYTNLIESGLVDVSILGDTYLSWTSTEQTGSTGAGAVNLTNGTIYVGMYKTGYNGYLAVRQFSTDYSGNLPAAVEEDILVYRNAEWTTLSRGLNGTFLGIEDNKVKYTTPSSSSGVTSVIAGVLVDVSSTTGNVTVNVDLSEATSDNTFSSTDQLIYLSGTAAKKGTVSGLKTYMQDNLDFGTGGGMVYPSAGIPVSTGSSWGSSIANNSSNWNTAYGDKINSLSVTGTDTKTITLTRQDGGTVSGTFTDLQGSGSGATNLSTSYSSTNITVNSDTGTDATINAATTSNAGVMSAADKTKLDLTTTANTTNTTSLDLSVRNHLKYTTSGASATITISNISDLKTGNIEIIYNYSSGTIITFQVPSTYNLNIAANIYNSTTNSYTKSVLSKSIGKTVYSYYISGTNIYINGTQNYF